MDDHEYAKMILNPFFKARRYYSDTIVDLRKIIELRLPAKAIVGVVQRRKRILIPNGATQIMSGDKLIIFTTSENAPIIKKYFEELK